MEMCYQILLQEKRVTQRELYYKLLCDSPDLFPSQKDVNRTIQGNYWLIWFMFQSLRLFCVLQNENACMNLSQTDVVALLRCSRYSLGVMASSRGLIAGRLILEVSHDIAYCSFLDLYFKLLDEMKYLGCCIGSGGTFDETLLLAPYVHVKFILYRNQAKK